MLLLTTESSSTQFICKPFYILGPWHFHQNHLAQLQVEVPLRIAILLFSLFILVSCLSNNKHYYQHFFFLCPSIIAKNLNLIVLIPHCVKFTDLTLLLGSFYRPPFFVQSDRVFIFYLFFIFSWPVCVAVACNYSLSLFSWLFGFLVGIAFFFPFIHTYTHSWVIRNSPKMKIFGLKNQIWQCYPWNS